MVLIHIMVSWCLLVSCYSLMLLCYFVHWPYVWAPGLFWSKWHQTMVELHSNWNRYEKLTTVGGLQQNYCTGPTYPHFLSCPGPHAPLLLPPTAAIHRAGRILWLPGITAWCFLFNYCNIIRLLHAKLVLHTFLSWKMIFFCKNPLYTSLQNRTTNRPAPNENSRTDSDGTGPQVSSEAPLIK